MKIKILLSWVITVTILTASHLLAQTDEYYRPDSLKGSSREKEEVIPKEQKINNEKRPISSWKNNSFTDRLRLGGSFGLSLGTITNINLSPMAGYELTENWVAWLGVTGMYYNSRFFGTNALYYGGRIFTMYKVASMVNLIGEVETLNVEKDTFQKYDTRAWIVSPLLGAAYTQPTGGRFIKGVHLSALYNFNYNRQVDDFGNNISPHGLFLGQPIIIRVTFL